MDPQNPSDAPSHIFFIFIISFPLSLLPRKLEEFGCPILRLGHLSDFFTDRTWCRSLHQKISTLLKDQQEPVVRSYLLPTYVNYPLAISLCQLFEHAAVTYCHSMSGTNDSPNSSSALSLVHEFSVRSGLRPNFSKCVHIPSTSSLYVCPNEPSFINAEPLTKVDSVQYLGLIID